MPRQPKKNLKKLIKNVIKSEIHPELKQASTAFSSYALGSTGTVPLSFYGIAQGDTAQTRDGQEIKVKSVHFRGTLYQHASATNTVCRLLLVRDNQQVADTAPTWTELFEGHRVVSPKSILREGRFSVLSDNLYALGTRTNVININIYKKVNHVVRYNGANSTDMQKGGLYLLCISNEPTNTATLECQSVVRYMDA